MQYGLQVVSAPPATVANMTKITRAGWGKTPSATSTWIASQLEPSPHQLPECIATVEPIFTWAQLVVEGTVGRDVLAKAWDRQVHILSKTRAP